MVMPRTDAFFASQALTESIGSLRELAGGPPPRRGGSAVPVAFRAGRGRAD